MDQPLTVAEMIEILKSMRPDAHVMVSAPVVGNIEITKDHVQNWVNHVIIHV